MLGVERGNIDLVIFSVLTLALAFRRLTPIHCLLISLAAILKIYPAFGLLTCSTRTGVRHSFGSWPRQDCYLYTSF